jgi:hypothetical protein
MSERDTFVDLVSAAMRETDNNVGTVRESQNNEIRGPGV